MEEKIKEITEESKWMKFIQQVAQMFTSFDPQTVFIFQNLILGYIEKYKQTFALRKVLCGVIHNSIKREKDKNDS